MSRSPRVILLSPDDGLRTVLGGVLPSPMEVVHAGDGASPAGLAGAAEAAAVVLDAALPWDRIADAAERLAHRGGGCPVLVLRRTAAGGLEVRRLDGPSGAGPASLGPVLADIGAALTGSGGPAAGPAQPRERSAGEFLSRMSHELRTPLNAILGFAQILEMEDLTPDQLECVKHILRGGRVLLAMINEVLDITRLETGRTTLSREPVCLVPVLGQVADEAAPQAAGRSVAIAVDPEGGEALTALADLERTRQVLRHLVNNAVTYNRSGGTVSLSCRPVAAGRVRVEVRDTGPGIASELLPRLFTPFDRLDAKRSGVEGSGLGLTLSKRLVEAMGGAIGVHSVPGEGSTFWFELPAAAGTAEAPDGSAPGPGAPSAGGDPLSILYIEDHEANVDLLRRILSGRRGVSLAHAARGVEGLDQARRRRPDLLLLDLNLPDISGEEVIGALRDDEATAGIPVLVISADATPARIEKLLALGACEYLTKPLDVQRFFTVVGSILGQRWSQA